jgi:hypothetical protein
MRLLFLPKEGLDLFRTLLDSETSRRVLRFYHPRRSPFGVAVEVATLSSGLSLVSELRWYVRRYVSGALFEVAPGRYATLALASQVYYGRELRLHEPWETRYLLVARAGAVERVPLEPGEEAGPFEDADEVVEVWDAAPQPLPPQDGGAPPVPADGPDEDAP